MLQEKENKVKKDGQDYAEESLVSAFYFRRFRIIDISQAILALFGFSISLITYDLEFNQRNKDIAIVLLYFIFISQTINGLFSILRYLAYVDWLRASKKIEQEDTLITTGYWMDAVAEMIVYAIHPSPFVWGIQHDFDNVMTSQTGFYYYVNDALTLSAMVKCLLIFRTALLACYWYSDRTARVTKLYACDMDLVYIIKILIKESPYQMIFSSYFISIFYFGIAIKIAESPVNRGLTNTLMDYENSFWLSIITMATIGYGDYFPITIIGRTIAVFTCIWGIIITSLMITAMTNSITPNLLEKKAVLVLDKLEYKEQLQNLSSLILTIISRLQLKARNNRITNRKYFYEARRVKMIIQEFQRVNGEYKALYNDNLGDELNMDFVIMTQDLKEILSLDEKLIEQQNEIKQLLGIPIETQTQEGEESEKDKSEDKNQMEN